MSFLIKGKQVTYFFTGWDLVFRGLEGIPECRVPSPGERLENLFLDAVKVLHHVSAKSFLRPNQYFNYLTVTRHTHKTKVIFLMLNTIKSLFVSGSRSKLLFNIECSSLLAS